MCHTFSSTKSLNKPKLSFNGSGRNCEPTGDIWFGKVNKWIQISNDEISFLSMNYSGETKKSCFRYLHLKHMLIIMTWLWFRWTLGRWSLLWTRLCPRTSTSPALGTSRWISCNFHLTFFYLSGVRSDFCWFKKKLTVQNFIIIIYLYSL